MDWFHERQAQMDLDDEFATGERQCDFEKGESDANAVNSNQPQTVSKTLFHRVARALHADKETDPNQIKIKQTLMSQLLNARRQHDLMRIIQLYQGHVQTTVAFADEELKELEGVLGLNRMLRGCFGRAKCGKNRAHIQPK